MKLLLTPNKPKWYKRHAILEYNLFSPEIIHSHNYVNTEQCQTKLREPAQMREKRKCVIQCRCTNLTEPNSHFS